MSQLQQGLKKKEMTQKQGMTQKHVMEMDQKMTLVKLQMTLVKPQRTLG